MSDPPPWRGVKEEDFIPGIRTVFASRLREQAEELAVIASDLDAADRPGIREAVEGAFRLAHSIRGTAATLLGHDLGEAAGTLAERAYPLRTSERVDEGALAELRALTADLRREVRRYLGWVDTEGGRTDDGPPPDSD